VGLLTQVTPPPRARGIAAGVADMTLDPIARLRVIAARLPEAGFVEAVLDAPYDSVWGVASDREHGVPKYESSVRAVEILERRGERLTITVQTSNGMRLAMEVILRDGYCLMQSEAVAIGMAARAEGRRTRFAHFECLRGRQVDAAMETKLAAELRQIEQLALQRASGPPSG
jgi:hypothetical protein